MFDVKHVGKRFIEQEALQRVTASPVLGRGQGHRIWWGAVLKRRRTAKLDKVAMLPLRRRVVLEQQGVRLFKKSLRCAWGRRWDRT